ncbi:class I SAM-dependent DNA methyltransferase [Dysgonomonas sp. Shenzhen-Wh21]|uniref:TaqI-like C-terminal specificity domain-containing protein n=1 Tax=Dysgonomonas sp. Shenzhen-Wh21 TaxID=2878548 RepID=UPI00372D762A
MSSLEQSIRSKIELVGTPLKDWDIDIYRGVLTGYNEAFIIDSETKEKLIKEDSKSAEIIRPLLRGRDIKRYGYQFADLYLITTFPSLKINIDQYPAVKQHLMDFGYDRLKQTGETGSRKKTNNQWFETQDSISYWEDFYKQKIIWKIIGNQMAFSIDSNEYVVNNACYILTGSYLEYLLSVLNSNVIKWYSYITNMNKTGVGDVQVGGQNVNLFPIPLLSDFEQEPFIKLVEEMLIKKEKNENTTVLETIIDNLIYAMYGLSEEEIQFISSQ